MAREVAIMTAITRVTMRDKSPLFSTSESRTTEISLPAAPWDVPYVKQDAPPPPFNSLEASAARRAAMLAFIVANPGCDSGAVMECCALTRGQLDGYLRTLTREGRVAIKRVPGLNRTRYFPRGNI